MNDKNHSETINYRQSLVQNGDIESQQNSLATHEDISASACLFACLTTLLTLIASMAHIDLADTLYLSLFAVALFGTGLVFLKSPEKAKHGSGAKQSIISYADLPSLIFPCMGGLGGAVLLHAGGIPILAPVLVWLISLGASLNTINEPTYKRLFTSLGLLFAPILIALMITQDTSLIAICFQLVALAVLVIIAYQFIKNWQNHTEQKLAEQQKQITLISSRFDSILSHSKNWVWESDPEHRLSFVTNNFEAITGAIGNLFAPTQGNTPIAEKFFSTISDGDHQKILETLKARSSFEDLEISFPKPGSPIKGEQDRKYYSLNGKPIFSLKNEFLGYQGCAVDITQSLAVREKQRNYQAILEKKIQTRTQELSARVSAIESEERSLKKQIRAQSTVISKIGDKFSQLAYSIVQNLKTETNITQALKGAKTIARLADNTPVLMGSDLSADDITPLIINLDDTALSAIHSLEAQAAEKSINLVYPQFCGLDVFGDPKLIRKALYEILYNSIDHCPEGTSIKLKIFTDASGIHLTVIDEGLPIDRIIKRNIALLMEQAEPAKKKNSQTELIFDSLIQQNAGLGLFLAAKIMRSHQGRISFSQPEDGRGNIVSLHLSNARLIKKRA